MNIEDLNNQPTNQNNNQMPTNQNISGGIPPVESPGVVSPPPMQEPSMPTGMENAAMANPMPPTPEPPINLQPEGMVPPTDNTPQPSAPEPLMGATLTPNSTLINNPSPSAEPNAQMNPGFTPPPTQNTPENMTNPFGQNPQNPFMNTMGVGVPTPPPMQNNMNDGSTGKKEKKKKDKKISTPLLILLIITLIAGIGYGIFYFLNTSKKTNTPVVILKLTTWELGEELPTNIEDYATITNIDPSSCTVDKANLNILEVSKQKYSISCPGLSAPVEGTLEMKDTKGPVVQTKDLVVSPNATVSIEDFITSCKDPSLEDSDCDISLKEGQTALEDIVKTAGSYEVTLVVKDNYNNVTEIVANLKVDENAPESTLSCEGKKEDEELKATITTTYNYGITAQNSLYNAKKTTTFKFTTAEDYKKAKETYESEHSLKEITGNAKFEDAAKAIIITSELSKEDLKTEFDTEQFPDSLGQIVEFHEETRKDTCSLS